MIETIKVDGLDELVDSIKNAIDDSGVPAPLEAEKGMFLHSNSSTGDIEWASIPSQLPGYTQVTAGKVLTVNDGGTDVEWDDVPSELPSYGVGDGGKALKVNSAGTGVEWGAVSSGTDIKYFDTEQRIGTWLNGVPVYQKVLHRELGYTINTNSGSGFNITYADLGFTGAEVVLHAFGVGSGNHQGGFWTSIPLNIYQTSQNVTFLGVQTKQDMFASAIVVTYIRPES